MSQGLARLFLQIVEIVHATTFEIIYSTKYVHKLVTIRSFFQNRLTIQILLHLLILSPNEGKKRGFIVVAAFLSPKQSERPSKGQRPTKASRMLRNCMDFPTFRPFYVVIAMLLAPESNKCDVGWNL